MATRHFKVSDYSGRLIPPGEGPPVEVTVWEHPQMEGGPKQLEGLPAEIQPLLDAALSVAVLSVRNMPGTADDARFVVEVENFDAAFTDPDRTVAEVLKDAPLAKGVKAAKGAAKSSSGGSGINYATLEHCGEPHPGRIDPREAELVRDNLEAVNARLARDGLRQIDPTTTEHAKRYGFLQPPASEPDTP